MADVSGALRSTVPISLFNRGLAGKVFEEVRQQGAKVVMKNNLAGGVSSPDRRSQRRQARCPCRAADAAF